MADKRQFHRLFALSWIDFFQGTSVQVETELDLSLKQQFLDLVIIHKGPEPIPWPLPDGFEDLSVHNLVTFKSHQEALNCFALQELVGHYVNYLKRTSPSLDQLLPEEDFRLFAVCARFPESLASRVTLQSVREGVYDALGFGLRIRIIVVSQLPQPENNALLHLFSAREELLRYGREHYRPYSRDTSSVLYMLFETYIEGRDMSDKMKEFVQQTLAEMMQKLPAEERIAGLPPEERLKGLSAEEVLRALSPEVRDALARQLKANGSSSPSK